MRLLLIGAPGSGKGTQAERLAEHFGLTHISSGDLLRRHVEEDSKLGQAVQRYVSRGDLVPDTLVMDALRKPVVAASESGGYILDGFPRTVEQAELAHATAKELGVDAQVAVHLDVPREELIRRLLARGRGSDDTEDVIDHRLEVYDQHTVPMLDYYAQRAELVRVDGSRSPDEVTKALITELEKVQRSLTL
ncbi:MAG: adenylate kinase [Actinomycetota bacterium]|nr:adenylate kinase [Actinomycetota bacterium]